MGAPTPPLLLKAIAALAGSGFITNPMPETATGSNAACVEDGFPPITMESELAGGKPPLGQDMNGFFFLVSSHTLYVECGQTYQFNSELAAEIGGYLAGTILGMTDGTGLWLCVSGNNTANPDTGGAGWVPLAAYGFTTVPVTGGTVTLTAAQSKYGVLVFSGALTGNQIVNVPTNVQQWLVINGTSGGFTLTVKTAAGGSAGVQIPQGGFGSPVGVYSIGDGNVYPTVAPLNLPIDQAPTPSTIVQRTNAGYVLATYFSASQGVDNDTVATVVTCRGDGFYRQNTLTNFESQMFLSGIAGQVSNGQVPYAAVAQWATTFFNSATLTGGPTAPTAGLGTSNTLIATTAFVNPGSVLSGAGPYYRKNADGSIDQWGNFSYVTAGQVAHTVGFAVAFPTACHTVTMTPQLATQVGWDTWLLTKANGSFNFTDDTASPNLGKTVTLNWRASGN